MEKKYLLLVFFLPLQFLKSHAQTALIRTVVGSTGGSAQAGSTLIQFTIGESAVQTLSANELLLTQGFQQPEFAISSPIVRQVKDMIVYPNPATTRTKVEFDLLSDAKVTINLVNNAGQVVHANTVNTLAGKIEYVIPLNGLASGLYHVVLYVNYQSFSEKLVIQ